MKEIDDSKNIYIACLKKGIEDLENGTSYIEMIEHLETEGFVIKEEFHLYFFIWFYDNFYLNGISNEREAQRPITKHRPWTFEWGQFKPQKDRQIEGFYSMKAIMTFDARQNYYNYLKLKGADKKTNIALYVAIFTTIISIVFSLVQIYYAKKQDEFNSRSISTQESPIRK
jgi:hypothetical protein